jgi:hypothetical protein
MKTQCALRFGRGFATSLVLALLWTTPGCRGGPPPVAWASPTEEGPSIEGAWPEWVIYDEGFADAVASHWYQLLDNLALPQWKGRVVIEFELCADGRLNDIRVVENTEGQVFGILCEKALRDPAPYQAWPIELRRLFGMTRQYQFTFAFDAGGEGRVNYAEGCRDWIYTPSPAKRTELVIHLPESGSNPGRKGTRPRYLPSKTEA